MALQALPLDEVLVMDARARMDYFEKYARYMPDAPRERYVIQTGSTTLGESDTYALRIRWEGWLRQERRKRKIQITKAVTS